MNNRFWILAVFLALALSAMACQFGLGNLDLRTVRGSGDIVTETRQISDFSEIQFAAFGNMQIELGNRESLRIEAEDNLLEHIETRVEGNALIIEFEAGVTVIPTDPVNFFLTVVELDSLSISGAGDVDAPDLAAQRFSIGISGAGDVDIDSIEADVLTAQISGAGDLNIDGGDVGEQIITISGAGNYRARDVRSVQTEVTLSGLGSATVNVQEFLDVNISGAGSVRYSGDPTVNQNVSGLGEIEKIGE